MSELIIILLLLFNIPCSFFFFIWIKDELKKIREELKDKKNE